MSVSNRAIDIGQSFPHYFLAVWRYRMRRQLTYIWARALVSVLILGLIPTEGAPITQVIFVVGAMWTIPEAAEAFAKSYVESSVRGPNQTQLFDDDE